MMKTLLLVLSFILSVGLLAQKSFNFESDVKIPIPKDLGLFTKAVPEVLFPPFTDLDCGDLTVISFAPPAAGFVAGTNTNLDFAKGQRFVNPNSTGIEILEVIVPFFTRDTSNLDASIYIDIYSDPLSDGPLRVIGTSDTLTMRDVIEYDTAINFTFFTFPEPVLVENDSFLIMVDMRETYTDSSSFTSIIHSVEGCGNGMDAYMIFPNFNLTPPRLQIASIFDRYSPEADDFDIELYIGVIYEAVAPSATRNPLANYSTIVAPNPTSGQSRIQFKTPKTGDFALTITDFSGRRIQEMRANSVADQGQFDVDLSASPAGIYLYHIDGPEGRQSGKLVKN